MLIFARSPNPRLRRLSCTTSLPARLLACISYLEDPCAQRRSPSTPRSKSSICSNFARAWCGAVVYTDGSVTFASHEQEVGGSIDELGPRGVGLLKSQ
jgi:hypothetical protein